MSSGAVDAKRVTLAGVAGLTSVAWYALPDVVAGRGARAAIKVGLVGVLGAAWVALDGVKTITGETDLDEVLAASRQQPWAAAIAGVAVTTSIAFAVAGEKAIFAHGERRRARGVRGAHTVPALALGAIAAAGALLEPSIDR